MAEKLNFISLPYTSPFVFLWQRTITLRTAELPLSIPYIYYHLKFRKHYSKTEMRNMYTVICTGCVWFGLYFSCLKFRSKICQLIQRHYVSVKHLLPFIIVPYMQWNGVLVFKISSDCLILNCFATHGNTVSSGGTFQSSRVASYDKPGVLLRTYCKLDPHATSGSVV